MISAMVMLNVRVMSSTKVGMGMSTTMSTTSTPAAITMSLINFVGMPNVNDVVSAIQRTPLDLIHIRQYLSHCPVKFLGYHLAHIDRRVKCMG